MTPGAGAGRAFDLVVIGSGPAGQKAAIQAAKAGHSVLIIEQEPEIGGACVHHGTIPSKTLRETAVALSSFRRRCGDVFDFQLPAHVQIATLLKRVGQVVRAHESYIGDQLSRNGIELWRGRARFESPHEISVLSVSGQHRVVHGEIVIVAVGSRPRTPPEVPVDHENILDSDSFLSMTYLPASLSVLGAGVIACEYASVLATLGVKVVMIDRQDRPLAFLDPELTSRFLHVFEASGGRFIGGALPKKVEWDGVSAVRTELPDGEVIETEKMLCALGRVANLEALGLDFAGLRPTARGFIAVDEHCRTSVGHIYAVGDVIGPPSLASFSMEQGRRAVCHALGIEVGIGVEVIPSGVYTVPEMASIGIDEKTAIKRHGGAMVGRARFEELARGQISSSLDGLLKMVADPDGERLLGVQIIGEGAAELIHVAQMALLSNLTVDTFIDNIFNFPTLAEGYRVAALDIVKQRSKRAVPVGAQAPAAGGRTTATERARARCE